MIPLRFLTHAWGQSSGYHKSPGGRHPDWCCLWHVLQLLAGSLGLCLVHCLHLQHQHCHPAGALYAGELPNIFSLYQRLPFTGWLIFSANLWLQIKQKLWKIIQICKSWNIMFEWIWRVTTPEIDFFVLNFEHKK